MTESRTGKELLKILEPNKKADKEWYLSLLDGEKQEAYEAEHLRAVLLALRVFYIGRCQKEISSAKEEAARLRAKENYSAEDFRAILEKNAEIAKQREKLSGYRPFFSEPYFARMDVVDEKEGYNSYYIGKKGDVNLEIVDWRAPLAVRYYQKSRVSFSINEYDYRTVLRRSLSVKNGKLIDFKNEYLSVKDVLTDEEIAGRDEEILFDPYLRSIIQSRKGDVKIRDIIRTIQEQQFEIITRPERESFVLQGCAGSGKTMILLHRLSYLMYNNEALRPRDVLVITPSDSFNAFIDELAQVLELGKISTVTLRTYFFRVLENEGIMLSERLSGEREKGEYLAFLYSDRFSAELQKGIAKLYDGVAGLFSGAECRAVSEAVRADCRRKREKYTRIKNASTRVRRAVLGEMKESKEGGFYFTKPFRTLMSACLAVEEFLSFTLEGAAKSADDFFCEFSEFYRSATYVYGHGTAVFHGAHADLASLGETVSREIQDLKRYRIRRGGEEVYTYAERIAKREELKAEILRVDGILSEMEEGSELFGDFFSVVRLSEECAALGKCRGKADVARFLYRETVRKFKRKYGMKGIYPSDGYAICAMLQAAGRRLTPRCGLVFIDEGQDVSRGEYRLLRAIHSDAAFNVFGDLKQNITPWRGIGDWESLGYPVFCVDRNYRNTNEIVEFVSKVLNADMLPLGLHGEGVKRIKLRGLTAFFRDKQGLKAVIAREEFLPLFDRRGYRLLSREGKLSKTHVNVMSVYESKGLEFSSVAVYDEGMSDNEKYIAYTRALSELTVIEP